IALPFSAPTLTATTRTGGSTPASKRPWRTPTWAAPRAPPPPNTHVRRDGPNVRLSTLLPGGKVLLLLVGQNVYRNSHRAELQPRNLRVDLVRHVVDPGLELARVLGEERGAQRLVGEAHVHARSRVAFGRGQVDEPSLTQHVQPPSVGQPVLLHRGPDLSHACGKVVQRLQ